MKNSTYGSFSMDADELLRKSGDLDEYVARAAQREIATAAFELPLRQGIMNGDILIAEGIFDPYQLPPGAAPEFPLDILAPGTEKEMVAFTIPYHGYIPQASFQGDYVMVPTYEVGSGVDWPLRLARDARWDIVGRCLEIFEATFVKKMNDDGWHTLMAAAADRGIMIFDGNAASGRFTLRLISLLKQSMKRKAGGNTASRKKGSLTDIYMSVEALEDMRSWTLAEVDEVTRREIFTAQDGVINRIYNVNLHELYEFGVGQEYQDFSLNALGVTLNGTDQELVIGIDLNNKDSFVMPVREQLRVFNDDSMLRMRRGGVFGTQEHGMASLDGRRIIMGSL